MKEKFMALDAYGPAQVVEFHHSTHREGRQRQQRRAFELVGQFLSLLHD